MYAKVKDKTIIKFPYSLKELRKEYPNVSFPVEPSEETLKKYGVLKIYVDSDLPEYDKEKEQLELGSPEFIGPVLFRKYRKVSYTDEEISLKEKGILSRSRKEAKEILREALLDTYLEFTLENKTIPKGHKDYLLELKAATVREKKVEGFKLPLKPKGTT